MGRRAHPTTSSTGSVPTATGPAEGTIPGWPDGRCRFDDIDPALLEQALVAATTRQDGQSMSAEVVRRRRRTLGAVLRSAVRRGHLTSNPIDRVEWRAPDRNLAVDVSTVPSFADVVAPA